MYFRERATCPWCEKGEVLADRRAKVTISTRCPKCNRVFWVDLETLHTEKAMPQKRKGKKKKVS